MSPTNTADSFEWTRSHCSREQPMADGSDNGALTRWAEADARTPSADDTDRVVCHVDIDCFYASCERLREPELVGEPVVVGMGYEPGETRGAVATASYEARAVGVESAMPIEDALERLPRRVDEPDADTPTGHYRTVEMEWYQSVAADVRAVLHDCADVVRAVSIDEAYLDSTERTSWEPVERGTTQSTAAGPATQRTLAEGYARHLKSMIEREAGVPASVGVAPNMATAKVASDADKPDGLVVVPPGSVESFLAPLPVAALHGVGPVTEQTLTAHDIDTAGDVAAADPAFLGTLLGDRGRTLSRRARGKDDRAVTPRGLPKSLSRESALQTTDDDERKRETVRELATDVASRARDRGCLYRTIGIKAVRPPFDVNTRERSLPGPVDDPALVESVSIELLREFDGDRVRKLGVRVSNLEFTDADQSTLAGFETTRGKSNRRVVRATGETLTDWVDGDPTTGTGCEESERADGQASLREWSSGMEE